MATGYKSSLTISKDVLGTSRHVTIPLDGVEVIVDPLAVTRPWIFPKERFVEYGPEDEWWARKYGFGHEGEYEPTAFNVGGTIVVHPHILKRMREVLDERRPSLDRFMAEKP